MTITETIRTRLIDIREEIDVIEQSLDRLDATPGLLVAKLVLAIDSACQSLEAASRAASDARLGARAPAKA